MYTGLVMVVWRPHIARWQWTLASFLLLVGFLFVIQFRASRPIRQEAELPTLRVRDLALLVQQQQDAQRVLQAEVDALRQKLSEYQTAAAQGRSSVETMAREVASYRLVLGLTPVEGSGVVLRLRAQSIPGGVVTPMLQAQDLSGLVNELWAAGVEAIAINGVRILATTGFGQDDRGIVAGRIRLSPPFKLEAIGNPTAIKATLGWRGGFVDGLRAVGFVVDVVDEDRLQLRAYAGPVGFQYATPVRQ